MRYDVLTNNGFRYEYFMTLDADTAKAARKQFKRLYAGDHRADDFKVRLSA